MNTNKDFAISLCFIFEREGWQSQPSLSKMGILLIRRSLTVETDRG